MINASGFSQLWIFVAKNVSTSFQFLLLIICFFLNDQLSTLQKKLGGRAGSLKGYCFLNGDAHALQLYLLPTDSTVT